MGAIEVLEDAEGKGETWNRTLVNSYVSIFSDALLAPNQSLNNKTSSQEKPRSFPAVDGWQVDVWMVREVVARRHFEVFSCRHCRLSRSIEETDE